MESRATTAPSRLGEGSESTTFGQPLKGTQISPSHFLPVSWNPSLSLCPPSSVLLLFSGLIGQLWKLHRHLTFSEVSGERISANPGLPPCLAQEVSEGRARPLPPKETESLPLCPAAVGDKAQPVTVFLPPSSCLLLPLSPDLCEEKCGGYQDQFNFWWKHQKQAREMA